jgi:hypothetical protein
MSDTRQIQKATVNRDFTCKNSKLPYGLTVEEVIKGIESTYSLLFEINNFLVSKGLDRLEDLLLGNSLSGMVSEILVKNISNHSKSMIRNEKIGGHPDLIPRDKYPRNQVLQGDKGIEVKSSIQRGGWQGHNPEIGWVMIFRYMLDSDQQKPLYERLPITFIQVVVAPLQLKDWSFSGRTGKSRRTITASINQRGMDKLRSNPIYQDPEYIVAPNKKLLQKYHAISNKE